MDYSFSIERAKGKAPYLQICEQVITQIHSGRLAPGARLPSAQELADRLGLSRNTVGAAYRRLERDGLVESTPGRGTFVLPAAVTVEPSGHTERIQRLFDIALEEALNVGLSLDAFSNLFHRSLRRHREQIRKTRICFVECNPEQLASIAGAIREKIGIETTPVLLDDLRARKAEVVKATREADLVLTSGYHAAEVMGLMRGRRVDVVALRPKLDSLIRIAHLPSSAEVALVCASERFAEDVRAMLLEAKIELPKLRVVRVEGADELRQRLEQTNAVIVSPGQRHRVEQVVNDGVTVIEFDQFPHEGSLDLIRTLVVEMERSKANGGARSNGARRRSRRSMA